MNRRDIVIGLIVLALLAGVVYWLRRPTPELTVPETDTQREESLESSFNIDIPENIEKANLTDVTGGSAMGLATRRVEGGVFMHTVLTDLPDPAPGTFYEGWLVRGGVGDDNFAFISTGALTVGKGGYMLNFESTTDYSDYTKVVITLETVADKTPEGHILEGSF